MENYQLVANNLELSTMQSFVNTMEDAKDTIQRFKRLGVDATKIEFVQELIDLITQILDVGQNPKSPNAAAEINEIIDELTDLFKRGLDYLQEIGVLRVDEG